jgi:hypothetical protein
MAYDDASALAPADRERPKDLPNSFTAAYKARVFTRLAVRLTTSMTLSKHTLVLINTTAHTCDRISKRNSCQT